MVTRICGGRIEKADPSAAPRDDNKEGGGCDQQETALRDDNKAEYATNGDGAAELQQKDGGWDICAMGEGTARTKHGILQVHWMR